MQGNVCSGVMMLIGLPVDDRSGAVEDTPDTVLGRTRSNACYVAGPFDTHPSPCGPALRNWFQPVYRNNGSGFSRGEDLQLSRRTRSPWPTGNSRPLRRPL